MAKKDFTLVSKILMSVLAVGDLLFIPPRELRRRAMRGEFFGNFSRYKSSVYYLKQKGLIKIVNKENERFIKLTRHGELEALIAKARLVTIPASWDGKWRLVIFDIPEDSKDKRDFIRHLLKKVGFKKLQASVYISPHPLNRSAVDYLKQTKLIEYIRIIKAEELDDDTDLKRKFKLKN